VEGLVLARMGDAMARTGAFVESIVQDGRLVTGVLAQVARERELDPRDRGSLERVLHRLTTLTQRAPFIYAATPDGGFVGVNRVRSEETLLLLKAPGEPLRRVWRVREPGDRSRPLTAAR
jgi:hypothetical protein